MSFTGVPFFPPFPQFFYDNGFGQQLGRFKIDLYKSQGTGDCGAWVTSICDKPHMGCKDSRKLLLSYPSLA